MPLVKRTYFIPCRGEECIRIAELIKENLGMVEAHIGIYDHGVEVVLYGYKTDVKRAWTKVKQVIGLHKELARLSQQEVKRIPLDYIVAYTRKTFPPAVLAEVLSRKGFLCRYESGVIETNADMDTIKDVVERIHEIYEGIKYDVRGTTTKYFVAASSIILGADPGYVVEQAVKMGILKACDEGGKPRLAMEWRRALEEFLKQHRGGE